MIKYDRFWDTVQKKGISNNMLHKQYNISKAQLHRLRYNQPVYTSTIDRLCNILDCKVEDIMEQFPDDNVF